MRVVPYTNDFYYRARPTIGVAANQVLPLNDTLGLNPALAGFKSLFDAGRLSVINGVGYPNPNRSHFPGDRDLADGERCGAEPGRRLAGPLFR